MKISPVSDIAIRGAHCPAGISVEAPDAIARELIAARLAVASKADASHVPAAPVIETALAPAATETAVTAANFKTKRR